MPCRVSEEEVRAIEESSNKEKYGIATTDADIAVTVACQALQFIEGHLHSGIRDRLPKLARLWWAEHKKRDAERKRDEQAAARQKENDERATLKRLKQKYPDEEGDKKND